MHTYTLFHRKASAVHKRVLWHKFEELRATSRPDALRRGIDPMHTITRTTSSCFDTGSNLVMAERNDRIDFDHYDFDGSYVEAAR
jgi:hypothetical protein